MCTVSGRGTIRHRSPFSSRDHRSPAVIDARFPQHMKDPALSATFQLKVIYLVDCFNLAIKVLPEVQIRTWLRGILEGLSQLVITHPFHLVSASLQHLDHRHDEL